MVRTLFAASLAGLLTIAAVSAGAAEKAADGLKKGDPIGAFYVTKVAGAADDGVEKGQQLCYRCKYGSRPMVMVFARETGGKVNELVTQLDQAVEQNKDAQLRGFLTLIGDKKENLTKHAEKVATTTKSKNFPIVVAEDTENGPNSYQLDPKAEVTVVIASDGEVISRHSSKAAELDVAAVMNEVKTMLK
ncbi:hypothetical protein [Candidatus Laterigemmans baculatus]|uniref:hypothetical protein n=1 Tax=Candidatus Laterigemmans baculatus TaxID=2770505 RepID=UPI0013D8FB10|nr:hypothetical protein [Candidatus Laterigemmans baculatus]